jgi:hypothetical protein
MNLKNNDNLEDGNMLYHMIQKPNKNLTKTYMILLTH